MNTFVFQSNYTWRKTGFVFLSDSLAYRETLNNNPGWDITATPPPGSSLIQPNRIGLGVTDTAAVGAGSNVDPLSYYPFDSREEFILSLARYNPSTLLNVDRYNGWSADSTNSLSGTISG